MAQRVLIIDDDREILNVYRDILSEAGLEIATAIDGEEGLTKAKGEKFDLILLDIMLPKVDGLAVLSQLKDNPATQQIPVAMLTNFGQDDLVKKALSSGAVDFLLKYNLTPGEVLERVQQLLKSPVTA